MVEGADRISFENVFTLTPALEFVAEFKEPIFLGRTLIARRNKIESLEATLHTTH